MISQDMNLKKLVAAGILFGALGVFCFIGVKYYSFVFSKTIRGEILRVEHIDTADAIIGSRAVPNFQLFSFAISLKDEKGEIHTSSTEDRQWAVVSAGQCAEVKFFPYPPWQLDKGRTYFGARLERLFDCNKP